MLLDLENMTPIEIVVELDKYIIGQERAKRAVAVALRNRFRRNQLPDDIRDEVIPKNIMMIGPTGVGKTEIARRLTKLSGAPFLKVEASKFTEVGYVGRDAESMIRDLIGNAIIMVKNEMNDTIKEEAQERVEERILDLLLPHNDTEEDEDNTALDREEVSEESEKQTTNDAMIREKQTADDALIREKQTADDALIREKFRKMLRSGELDDRRIEITSHVNPLDGLLGGSVDVIGIDPVERFGQQGGAAMGIGHLFSKTKHRHVSVKRAKEILLVEEREKLIDLETVYEIARERTEKGGIIFIDEIDKIATRDGSKSNRGPDISREGVQRDILPIVEGTTVSTKYGIIDTRHILFIAAGAFHACKPSDLLPELQGRFPVQVELEEMTAEMFEKILTQPRNALIRQYTELMRTEDVELIFTPEAIRRLAIIAVEMNSNQENIGTRRLHSVLETLLEELSFNSHDYSGKKETIDEHYVDKKFETHREKHDLRRHIL